MSIKIGDRFLSGTLIILALLLLGCAVRTGAAIASEENLSTIADNPKDYGKELLKYVEKYGSVPTSTFRLKPSHTEAIYSCIKRIEKLERVSDGINSSDNDYLIEIFEGHINVLIYYHPAAPGKGGDFLCFYNKAASKIVHIEGGY
jgi:hypothetical protein